MVWMKKYFNIRFEYKFELLFNIIGMNDNVLSSNEIQIFIQFDEFNLIIIDKIRILNEIILNVNSINKGLISYIGYEPISLKYLAYFILILGVLA
jgi:hypothetical protein